MQIKGCSLRWLTMAVALGVTSGCAAKAPVRVAAIASLPAEINVREWPYWLDIPIQSTNSDRVWRTVIDVIGERAAQRLSRGLGSGAALQREEGSRVRLLSGESMNLMLI